MRNPRLKWSLGLAVAGLLVLLAARHLSAHSDVTAQLAALRGMGHPTSLAELAARYPAVPAAENAGPALEALLRNGLNHELTPASEKLLSEGHDLAAPWKEAERALAAAHHATNAAALASLHELLQRPRIQLVNNLSAGMSMRLPEIFSFIQAARTLALAVRWETEGGQPAAAAAHLGDALELARLLAEEPAVLVMAIGSLATANLALTGLETALNQARFPDAELRQLQAALDRAWKTNLVEQSMVSEFCIMRDLAELPAPAFLRVVGTFGGPGGGPPGLEELYFRFFVASGMRHADFGFYTRRTLRYLEILRGDPRQREALMAEAQAETLQWIQDHHLWTRFSALVMPRYFNAAEQDSRNQIRNRAAHAALAVERHRLRHGGEPPEKLEELVPEFLDRVPQDLYAAAPLRYRRLDRGYVIHSLGSDRKDDGGNGTNDVDLAFRVGR